MLKRKSGLFMAAVIEASEELKNKKSIMIVSANENGFAERLANGIKYHCGISIDIVRITKKVPQNNRRLVFDKKGEIIGVDIISQIDDFIGWELKLLNK